MLIGRVSLLVVIALLPTPAIAAPTYLTCTFPRQPTAPVDLTVDEAAGTVTLYMPHSGYTATVRGTFRPDTLQFGIPDIAYSINRVDLSASRLAYFMKSPEAGMCRRLPTPKREF